MRTLLGAAIMVALAAVHQAEAEEVIRPHPGPQTRFMACWADVAGYGGGAGSGKSYVSCLEALRHVENREFRTVLFRRTTPELRAPGGLWEETSKLFPRFGARGIESRLNWIFPSGARVLLRHMQHAKHRFNWQGSQIPLIIFDEGTHFEECQFWYLLSRNRSVCGIDPYMRLTCNPDPNSWVKRFFGPWLDKRHKDPAKSGEIRWFVREGNNIHWARTRGELMAKFPLLIPKSATFIHAKITDNPTIIAENPEYLANLLALPYVERMRLLGGDWDILEGGNMFRREWFRTPLNVWPVGMELCRFWDLAGTEATKGGDPDWTVGALVGKAPDTPYIIIDIIRIRATPGEVEETIRQTAVADRMRYGDRVEIIIEQEPGSSGKAVIDRFAREVLDGFDFRGLPSTGNKVVRARPASAQAEAGNVRLIAALWNADFLNEAAAFPNEAVHDDQVDAVVGGINRLANRRIITGR